MDIKKIDEKDISLIEESAIKSMSLIEENDGKKEVDDSKLGEIINIEADIRENLNKICIICGDVNTRGIVIMNQKICVKCEEKAVKEDIGSEFYEFYKDRIFKNVVGKLKELG